MKDFTRQAQKIDPTILQKKESVITGIPVVLSGPDRNMKRRFWLGIFFGVAGILIDDRLAIKEKANVVTSKQSEQKFKEILNGFVVLTDKRLIVCKQGGLNKPKQLVSDFKLSEVKSVTSDLVKFGSQLVFSFTDGGVVSARTVGEATPLVDHCSKN